MGKSLFEKTVKDRITHLENLIIKEENASKWNEYLDDLELLNRILYPTDDFSFYRYTDKFKTESGKILKRNYLWSIFKSFGLQTNKILETIPAEKERNISNSDLFELTHNFFKTFDKDYYNYFLKIYNNRHSNTKFSTMPKSGLKGENIFIKSLNENFSVIYRSFTIDDVFSVIHESTHGTSALINPIHTSNNKYLLAEVDSIFMELIATDYIDNVFNKNEGALNRIHKHNSYCCISMDVNDMIKLTKLVGNKNITLELLVAIAKKRMFIEENELRNLLDCDFMNHMSYLISYIIAIQLYELYKRDADKAKFLFKRFILTMQASEEEYYKWILEQGINPTANIEKYHENINSEILRLTKKSNKF